MKNTLNTKLFRDLKNLRTQTLTTALLLICGISLLVSSWSAFVSLRNARDNYYQQNHFADVFAEFKTAPMSIEKKLNAIPGVNVAEARIVIEGLIYVKGQTGPAIGRFVTAPTEGSDYLNRLYLRRGRLPTNGEQVEVAVHEAFARAHGLELESELNIIIQGNAQRVKIVSITISPEFVYPLNPATPLPDDLHFGVLWVPQKQLEFLAKMKDESNSIIVKLENNISSEGVLREIDEVLRPYGNRGAYQRKYQLSNMFVEDEIQEQKVLGMFMPFIFLSTASFLVNIIISRLITLQRGQVATLKALGYTNNEVSFHYLKIIMVMVISGTIPGVFLGGYIGTLLTESYKKFFHFPLLDFSLSFDAAVIGLMAGLLPCVIGSLFTLNSIYRLTPAEAMRPPAPPEYLPTFFERWNLQKYFKVSSRMIWRNLFQRPIRLIIVVLSISASLAIIITAGSWSDMIDFVITTQFQRQQKEDISVSFQKPLPESAIRELLKVDGVSMSEGYRNIPIRLKFKNYKREIGLIGRRNTNQLVKILDVNLNEIKIPEHGILLGHYFREEWGVNKGDLVEVELLEDEYRKISLRVSGFSDDLMGIGSYINYESLLSKLKENTGYNMASLKVDPSRMSEIYLKLKGLPLITSVVIKKQLLQGFEQTMGGLIKVFTAVLTIFSLAITVGIIYNSIRVSLSERSWEMSSLMVLGFSKGSVYNLLASEVIIHVLLALIPGCVGGWGLVYFSMKLIHAETFSFPVKIDRSTFAMSILFVFIVLGLSLLVMFKMISHVKLADALKIRE